LTKEFYEFIEYFQGEKNVIIPLHTTYVNVGGDKVHKPTLHTKDFNVQGDKIHKPTPTQETHDERMNFNYKITSMNFKIQLQNVHGMPRDTSFVDVSKNIHMPNY
jgi:hypothetical protein